MITQTFIADGISDWLVSDGLVSIATSIVQVGFIIMAILISIVLFRKAIDGF